MKLSGAKAVSIITGSLIFGLISWPTYVEGGPANSAQSVIDVSAFEWNLGGKQLRFVFERGNFALWDRSKWGRLEIGDRGNAPGKTILRGNLTALAIHGAPTSDLTGNLTPRDIAQFTIHSAENYGVILSGEFGPAESGGRNYLYFVDSDGRLAGFKYGFGSYT